MSTASGIARATGRGGPLAALLAALLIAVPAGAGVAQRESERDTVTVVKSISIGPDGIVIERRGDKSGADTLTIKELEKTTARDAAKAHELEHLKRLEVIGRETEGHDIVRFGEDIHVRADKQVRGSVVSIGGSIVVEGQVIGDVVAVGGSVTLESGASVTGDAVSVAGSMELESGSSVRGDAVSVGGKVIEHEGSYVAGDTVSVGFIPAIFFKSLHSPFTFAAMDVTGYAIKTLIILLLAWAAAAIFPDRVRRMIDYSESSIWLSALVGFAAVIALPIAVILLIVTLIGIPVALILPIAFGLASIVAYAAGAGLLGYRFGSRLVSKAPGELSLAQAVLLGVLIVGAVRILGKLLGMGGPVLWPLAVALGVVAVLAGLFIYLVGLGSLFLTKFGRGPKPGPVPVTAGAPGPPPPPAQTAEGIGGPPGGGAPRPGTTPSGESAPPSEGGSPPTAPPQV